MTCCARCLTLEARLNALWAAVEALHEADKRRWHRDTVGWFQGLEERKLRAAGAPLPRLSMLDGEAA